MGRSKQKKRRNSLNFGEIEGAKSIVVARSRARAKASMVIKIFALFAMALKALSTIIEAITKIVRSFISQCVIQSRPDFSIDLLNTDSIANGLQNKCACRTSLPHSFF